MIAKLCMFVINLVAVLKRHEVQRLLAKLYLLQKVIRVLLYHTTSVQKTSKVSDQTIF